MVKEPLLDISNTALFPAPITILNDTLETTTGGWIINANRTDTATTGKFQRAVPHPTRQGNTALQLTPTSGTFDLVTGAAAGTNANTGDIDGGTTSARSRSITLPTTGNLTLSLRTYIAHLADTSSADYLRVTVTTGTTKTVAVNKKGTIGTNTAGTWTTSTLDLTPLAGHNIRILIEAADNGRDNTFEAGIDDIHITQH
jgi:aminopeptidase S